MMASELYSYCVVHSFANVEGQILKGEFCGNQVIYLWEKINQSARISQILSFINALL